MQIIKDKKLYTALRRRNSIKLMLLDLINVRPTSYINKNFTNLQCCRNRNRSIYDIYNILKTEYKSITWNKYLKIVFKTIIFEDKTRLFYCPDIKALVFTIPRYEKDKKYPFLMKLDYKPWNTESRMKEKGFKHEFANLENINKAYKKYINEK